MLTTVITHATGDLLPAADWNTYIRDNLNWLVQPGASVTPVANILTVTNEFHSVTGGGTVNTLIATAPVVGQRLRLLCAAPTTFASGAGNILTLTGGDRAAAANEIVEFAYDGASWREATLQGGLVAVYDNVLAAPATSVTTGTLPAGCKHLLAIVTAQTDSVTNGTDRVGLRVNGDAGGANYDWHAPDGTDGSGQSAMFIGQAIGGGSSNPLRMGLTYFFIPNYNEAVLRKTVLSVSGGENNGPMAAGVGAGIWLAGPAALTTLTFVCRPTAGTTNFIAGSRFTVYGMA